MKALALLLLLLGLASQTHALTIACLDENESKEVSRYLSFRGTGWEQDYLCDPSTKGYNATDTFIRLKKCISCMSTLRKFIPVIIAYAVFFSPKIR